MSDNTGELSIADILASIKESVLVAKITNNDVDTESVALEDTYHLTPDMLFKNLHLMTNSDRRFARNAAKILHKLACSVFNEISDMKENKRVTAKDGS